MFLFAVFYKWLKPFYQPALCNLISGCKIISRSRRLRSISCFKPKALSSYSVRILPRLPNISSAAADSLSFTKDFSICSTAIPQRYKQQEKRKVQLPTTWQDSSVTKQDKSWMHQAIRWHLCSVIDLYTWVFETTELKLEYHFLELDWAFMDNISI